MMVSRGIKADTGVAEAAQAAASAATGAAAAALEPENTAARPTAVRLNWQEYEYLKGVFESHGHGLKLSTGIKMAALWIADRIEDGALGISKAGITERRR
jgi:hypothetical protein